MIHIQKGSPPPELQEARRKGLTCYDGMDTDTKDAIKRCLFEEQYHLCAYCMRLLSIETMQIEHYIAQNPEDGEYNAALTIDYHNMLGVCRGGKGKFHKYRQLTCDQHRKNAPLTVDPLSAHTIAQIKYSTDGTILSDNEKINDDLDKILNLNCPESRLKENRKAALDALKKWVNKNYSGKHLSSDVWKKIYIGMCTAKAGSKPEYVGILEWYIKRKIEH